jgi:hypothetical protein
MNTPEKALIKLSAMNLHDNERPCTGCEWLLLATPEEVASIYHGTLHTSAWPRLKRKYYGKPLPAAGTAAASDN